MRRMLVPEVKIKSKIIDDTRIVDMGELEPYVENGIIIVQTIITDIPDYTSHQMGGLLVLQDTVNGVTYKIRNGSIITLKINVEGIWLYGDFYENDDDANPYDLLYFDEFVLGNLSIQTAVNTAFDLYVIKN